MVSLALQGKILPMGQRKREAQLPGGESAVNANPAEDGEG